jgi:hypothetical protein
MIGEGISTAPFFESKGRVRRASLTPAYAAFMHTSITDPFIFSNSNKQAKDFRVNN